MMIYHGPCKTDYPLFVAHIPQHITTVLATFGSQYPFLSNKLYTECIEWVIPNSSYTARDMIQFHIGPQA